MTEQPGINPAPIPAVGILAATGSHEPLWRDDYDAKQRCTYRLHRDGRVLAYGPERDGPRPGLWRASQWSADPRTTDDARHVGHLFVDTPLDEAHVRMSRWALASLYTAEDFDTFEDETGGWGVLGESAGSGVTHQITEHDGDLMARCDAGDRVPTVRSAHGGDRVCPTCATGPWRLTDAPDFSISAVMRSART